MIHLADDLDLALEACYTQQLRDIEDVHQKRLQDEYRWVAQALRDAQDEYQRRPKQ